MKKLLAFFVSLALFIPLCGALSANAEPYPGVILSSGHGRYYDHRRDRPMPPPRPDYRGPRHHFRGPPPPPPPRYRPYHDPRYWHHRPQPRYYRYWR